MEVQVGNTAIVIFLGSPKHNGDGSSVGSPCVRSIPEKLYAGDLLEQILRGVGKITYQPIKPGIPNVPAENCREDYPIGFLVSKFVGSVFFIFPEAVGNPKSVPDLMQNDRNKIELLIPRLAIQPIVPIPGVRHGHLNVWSIWKGVSFSKLVPKSYWPPHAAVRVKGVRPRRTQGFLLSENGVYLDGNRGDQQGRPDINGPLKGGLGFRGEPAVVDRDISRRRGQGVFARGRSPRKNSVERFTNTNHCLLSGPSTDNPISVQSGDIGSDWTAHLRPFLGFQGANIQQERSNGNEHVPFRHVPPYGIACFVHTGTGPDTGRIALT